MQKLKDNHYTIKDIGHHEWCAHAKPAFREEHPSTGTNMARGPGMLLQLLAEKPRRTASNWVRTGKRAIAASAVSRHRGRCGQAQASSEYLLEHDDNMELIGAREITIQDVIRQRRTLLFHTPLKGLQGCTINLEVNLNMWKHTRIQKTVYARLVNVIEELE
jgi:hypothetical protein